MKPTKKLHPIKQIKQFFLLTLFAVLAVLVMFSTSWATIYYVDATNGDNSNPGVSESTPWKTIAKVNASNFNPGDFILFKRGEIWREQLVVSSSGTSNLLINFGAYGNGDDPIIDGGNARTTSISIFNKTHITIQNIKCINWLVRGIYIYNAPFIVVKECTIAGGDGIAPDHGIQVQCISGNLMPGIQIKNNNVKTISTSENDSIFYTGILVQGVNGAVISGNTVNPTNTAGIRLTKGGIKDNINCIIENNETFQCYGQGIAVLHSDNTIVRYNVDHEDRGGGISFSFSSDECVAYYNLIYNNTRSAISFNGFDINNNSQNGKIYNNTVFKVFRHCLMIDDEIEGSAQKIPCNGWVIKNNIFDASENIDTGVGNHPERKVAIGIRGEDISYTSDNNLLRNCDGYVASYGDNAGTLLSLPDYQEVSGRDANSIDASPLFIDTSNGNFQLQFGSPAIAEGVNLGLQKDLAGNILPQNGSVTIGAFEKADSIYPSIPSTPSNFRVLLNNY